MSPIVIFVPGCDIGDGARGSAARHSSAGAVSTDADGHAPRSSSSLNDR
jgi:hypothetical protein